LAPQLARLSSPLVISLPARLQAVPNAANTLSEADLDALTKRTQDGGTEVVQAKAGKVRPALLGPCYSCPC
jgi:malate/lactate dehydrogenase